MSTPFKRGGVWAVYVPCKGRLLQKSCATRNKELAKKMGRLIADLKDDYEHDLLDAVGTGVIGLGELYAAHVANALPSLKLRLTGGRVSDHLEPWLAWKKAQGLSDASRALDKQRMEKLFAPLGAAPLEFTHELTTGRIVHLLSALDVTSGTRRQYLAELRSFCRYLVIQEKLSTNPATNRDLIQTPKKNRPRRRWVQTDVDRHIVECADEPYRAVLAVAHGTGADRSTLLTVRVRDVNLDRGTINLLGSKTAARHRFNVPVEEWALPYLRDVLANRSPGDLLFPGLSGDAISRAHDRATKAAGVPDYSLRDGRHSYAIRAILAGHNLRHVSAWLGHSNLSTTYSVYVHFDGEVKRRLDGE